MAHTLTKDKAKILRSRGASISDIVTQTGAPKSTVRFWCRDIILTRKQQKILFGKQKLGGIISAEKLRKQRIATTEKLKTEGKLEIGILSKRELTLVGTALYWAEGYNKGDGEFGFTNSNPRMINLVLKWLKISCHIKKEDIRLRICVNNIHARRINTLKKYWINTTGILAKQFSKPTLIKVSSKKRYKNIENYFGTLRIKVSKSTNLRRKIMGWIEGLATQ